MKLAVKKVSVRGEVRHMLDLRPIGEGRMFFSNAIKANQKLQAIQRNGIAAEKLPLPERIALVEAKETLAPFGVTIREAVSFFVKHHRAAEEKRLVDAIEILISTKERNRRRPRYTQQLRYDLEAFCKSVSNPFCHEIDSAAVEGWLHGNGWEPKTIKNKSIALHTLFAFAVRKGWMVANPIASLDRITVDGKRPGILTPEQAQKLMDAARKAEPSTVPYLALALFAGVRPAELERIGWTDIKDGLLRIESAAAKVRHHRIVHLTENCKAWLALGGELPPVGLSDRLMAVRKAAGFEYSVQPHKRGKKAKKFQGMKWSHNCLRHSFCSYYLVLHGLGDTAREAGNSEDKIHEHYKELVTKGEAERFFAVMPASRKPAPDDTHRTGG